MEILSEPRCFDGRQLRIRHRSEACDCAMTFSLFLPPAVAAGAVPAIYWLSGLTCTDENFATKAGAQRVAAELGVALVMADTSPRGDAVPTDPEGGWDCGHGAGFYVDATEPPWDRHYRMYDYVTRELPALVEAEFPIDRERRAVSGHSMGGHGALVVGLRNPGRYRAISAFSPICAPSEVPWGRKALGHYLGDDPAAWASWDACRLLARADQAPPPILVEQGTDDPFLAEQLHPHRLEAIAAERPTWPLRIRRRAGYDHSYWFIATFIEDHLRFLRRALDGASDPFADADRAS